MDSREMIELCKAHTLFTWTAQGAVDPLPVARAEGVYLYTPEGKRILDFNSQLMSVLIGHGHPKVIAAMKKQLDQLIYVYPQAATEPRARLGKMLAELTPGDINHFFFTSGGAESNENAIKIARQYTGRFKILSGYRSYHGATNATMQLTGDPRRWSNEPGSPGFVHMMDPRPYRYSFGATEAERTANHLRYLDEVLMYEGPQNVAAIFVESVVGTNGVLVPPAGWLAGVRELTRKHGILLVCDEVMAGFGRTGKMFGFEHGGIVPDIVTMAKGLTSSYVPLGAMGVSDPIAAFMKDHAFMGGSTYNAHPFAMATAVAVLEATLEDGLVENSRRMGEVMRAEMDRLAAAHPSVAEARNVGLFGMIDLRKNAAGEPLAPYNGTHPAMTQLAAFFREEGLFTFTRWASFTANPPLCITEAQLREGFAIIDRGLAITDSAFEG